MKRVALGLSIEFAAMCIAVMGFGQAITSSISGTVMDSSGGAVPGATPLHQHGKEQVSSGRG